MVVEDQDARAGPVPLPVEPGGGEPANAGTDHNEVIALVHRTVEDLALPRAAVGDLEDPGMLPAQAGQVWRVVSVRGFHEQPGRGQAGADRERHTVEKVAPRDLARHVILPNRNRLDPARTLIDPARRRSRPPAPRSPVVPNGCGCVIRPPSALLFPPRS